MPTPHLNHTMLACRRWAAGLVLLFWAAAVLTACQEKGEQDTASTPPPVGHYEGSITAPGQPEERAALDIRHPSPGHYEVEFTVPGAATLNFVADTLLFSNHHLQLRRPGRLGQVLTLSMMGDFWRGSLALDSVNAAAILVKRGAPAPSTYRVAKVRQGAETAWLFAPSDTATPGLALALLPDGETAATAALWADALAREGIIVLVLPQVDSATAESEAPRLQRAMRLLRNTPGADTANIGAWASGARAAAVAQVLGQAGSPRVAFVVAQNAVVGPAERASFRELRTRKLPLLGLYGGEGALQKAAGLRAAMGGRRAVLVRTYRTAGPDLFVATALGLRFGAGLPGDVLEWLRSH